jgi:hypothetical protein
MDGSLLSAILCESELRLINMSLELHLKLPGSVVLEAPKVKVVVDFVVDVVGAVDFVVGLVADPGRL